MNGTGVSAGSFIVYATFQRQGAKSDSPPADTIQSNWGIEFMRITLAATLAITYLTLMVGCNQAKSPEEVAKDVAAAQQKAANEVANSEKDAQKDLTRAADKVGDKLIDFNNTAANDAYNLAVAKADGDRKVTLANCAAANGDAQKKCRDQAEADYQAAKADAKAAAQAVKQ